MLSVSHARHSPGFVSVIYHDFMSLRLPLPATSLAPLPSPAKNAKFTLAAIEELVSLAVECEVIPCSLDPLKSGNNSHPPSSLKLPPNSKPSSRR